MKNINILIARKTQSEAIAAALSEALAGHGYECSFTYAASGVTMLKSVNEQKYDVIITQLMLEATPLDINLLVSLSEANEGCKLILSMPNSYRGSEFAAKLLSENLLYGIFKPDSTIDMLVRMIVSGITRKEARAYYGLVTDTQMPAVDTATDGHGLIGYITKDSGEDLSERLAYVKSRISDDEFKLLIKSLDEDTIARIRDLPEYAPYTIGTDKVQAAPSKQIQIIKQFMHRKIIGVAGAYSGAGTTTVAVSLAKTIAEHEDVTFVEIPRKGKRGVYDTYDLATQIGPSFKSVPHMVAAGKGDYAVIRNLYEGINFWCSNPDYEMVELSELQLLQLINASAENMVIDLGTSLEEALNSGLANLLTHIVIVYEQRLADEYLSEIKNSIAQICSINVAPLLMCITDKIQLRTEQVGGTDVYHVKHSLPQTVPLGLSNFERKMLLSALEITSEKRRTKRVKTVTRGVMDIAVTGIAHYVGTTYTALMLADSLRHDCRVAYYEANPSGHIQHMLAEIGFGSTETCVSVSGVDIYYGIDYPTFANKYRNKYDYVILDFGLIDSAQRKKELFANCLKKFVCISPSPWRLYELDAAIERVNEYVSGNADFLLPLGSRRNVRDYQIHDRTGKHNIIPIPYSDTPIGCPKNISDYLHKLIET